MQELLIYLVVAAVYAGVGFLMKAVIVHPYYALCTTIISLVTQLYTASGYIGRNKIKKNKWTTKGLMNTYLPIMVAGSVLAGIAGASGVIAVASFSVEKSRRVPVKLIVAVVAGLLPLRNLRTMLDRSVEKLDAKKQI
eukprot:TRINITY_DN35570_c0_g1_i1.p1 TRINITY_DN35570_c0_g1~~TRINITY_DN35570_c0_g1_i1.p1  ORF type:complete len:138 (+),score=30.38 TRINITY_DN35570_c0_g1_i1:53-466(+)